MEKRTASVGTIKVNSVQFASCFQVGDHIAFSPKSYALAVQRQVPYYWGTEGDIEYPVFHREMHSLSDESEVEVKWKAIGPQIQVDQVKIHSVAASSLILLGSSQLIDADSRTKHVRQFVTNLNAHGTDSEKF